MFRLAGSNQVFLQVWFRQASGFLAGPSLPDGGELPSALAAVDVNGDGALDLDADQMPVLGTNYTITMASRAGSGISGALVVAVLAVARVQPVAVPGLGLLHIDPQSIVQSAFDVTGIGGLRPFQFALPLTPALAGLEVYWQGAADGGSGLRLTNLLVDRLLL